MAGMRVIGMMMAVVLAGPASAQPLASRSFDCVIEPEQVVKLASQATGLITRLDVDRGDRVAKGQVLGTLSDDVERANLALARARGVQLELSLTPLYQDQLLAEAMMARLRSAGFAPWTLWQGFADAASGRLLQIDAIFVREDAV